MARQSRAGKLRYVAFLQRLTKEFSYEANIDRAPHHANLEKEGSPISIGCDRVGKNSVFVCLYVRTTSWDFEGERTDLHDALSVLVCSFLRFLASGVSCQIWDVPHPVAHIPKTEIYARYVTFEQPLDSFFTLDTGGYKRLSDVLKAIRAFEILLPHMTAWVKRSPKAVELTLYDWQAPEIAQYNLRRNPCWFYYRSIRPSISVFCNPPLAAGLRVLLKEQTAWEALRGHKGDLYVSRDAKNFIGFAVKKRAIGILRALPNEKKADDVCFIPIENYLVAVGIGHVLFLKSDCGHKRFEQERESLRSHHRQEAALLFPPSKITWRASIDDAAFEELILQLLMHEPGVRWVRKMGHTNEPEGGRDIIAEWDTPPVSGQTLEEGRSPVVMRRVVVQCKTSRRAVGKAQVRDIHDLLKRHNASGFLLAVSSHLTVGLIGHLSKLGDQAPERCENAVRTRL